MAEGHYWGLFFRLLSSTQKKWTLVMGEVASLPPPHVIMRKYNTRLGSLSLNSPLRSMYEIILID